MELYRQATAKFFSLSVNTSIFIFSEKKRTAPIKIMNLVGNNVHSKFHTRFSRLNIQMQTKIRSQMTRLRTNMTRFHPSLWASYCRFCLMLLHHYSCQVDPTPNPSHHTTPCFFVLPNPCHHPSKSQK